MPLTTPFDHGAHFLPRSPRHLAGEWDSYPKGSWPSSNVAVYVPPNHPLTPTPIRLAFKHMSTDARTGAVDLRRPTWVGSLRSALARGAVRHGSRLLLSESGSSGVEPVLALPARRSPNRTLSDVDVPTPRGAGSPNHLDRRRYGSSIDHIRDLPSISFASPSTEYANSGCGRGRHLRPDSYRRPASA
jgi:hypothetical protein